MERDELRAAVAANGSLTAMADAFRRAFGIERRQRPEPGREPDDGLDMYRRLMKQRYGAMDRGRS